MSAIALVIHVIVFLFLQELLIAVVADLIQICIILVTYNIGSTSFALELLALVDGHSISAVVASSISLRIDGVVVAASFRGAST